MIEPTCEAARPCAFVVRAARRALGTAASAAACALLAGTACAQAPSGALAAYRLDVSAAQRHDLPGRLAEISGLATTADGRVFAHHDESAEVFEIDTATGRIVKSFSVGDPRRKGDFEGIAIARGRFFLVTSDGALLEFGEGANGERVPYRQYDTGLADQCEIEGLTWDARTDVLLLACKTTFARALRGRIILFSFSLTRMSLDSLPRFAVPLDFLSRAGLRRSLRPSGVAVHPVTGTIFIVAARQRVIVEIGRDGRVLGVRPLAARAHPQAEGIEFLANGTLLIADERARRGLLTLYSPPAGPNQE